MNSTALARTAALPLETADAFADRPDVPHGGADRSGFDIGWDHARHGLVPPAELLLEGTPPGQGWRAGRAVYRGRTLAAPRPVRLWLALRLRAWREGAAFDAQGLTPQALARIHGEHCPVLRVPLGGAERGPEAPVWIRLDAQAPYAADNLVSLSQRAAQARAGVGALQALRCALGIQGGAPAVGGLDAAAWFRLAALQSFATPLPFALAARMPLALLPPARLRLRNAVQRLQVLLTLQFTTPGWAARTRAIGAWLPEPALRQEYQLFIGALAPRVLEAGVEGRPTAQALEDAWLQARVQRRWQSFVLGLGEAATAALLERLLAQDRAGPGLLGRDGEQARTDPSPAPQGPARDGPPPGAQAAPTLRRPGRRWPVPPKAAAAPWPAPKSADRPPRRAAPGG
ncbi:MAG: hypothetical protein KGJ24_10720 [Burkholderiales bacterium]|nr:hypothetical protein [Burkholderiales bacterium]